MKMSVLLAAGIGLVAGSVGAFSWDDAVDGEIVIPSGVTAHVTDADVSKVEALTKISFESETSRLKFDNTVSMTVNAKVWAIGGSASDPAVEFTTSAPVTFNDDFVGKHGTIKKNTYFRLGNVTVNGAFGEGNTEYTHFAFVAGTTTTVSRTATIKERPYQYFEEGSGTLRTAVPFKAFTSNQNFGIQWGAANTIVCDCEDVLGGVVISASGGSGIVHRMELNGYDQHLPYFSDVYLDVPTAAKPWGDGRATVFASETPATVTIASAPAAGTSKNPFRFEGAAGFAYDATNGTQRIAYYGGLGTGALNVKAGTVELFYNACWAGANVTIGAAGRLVCTSAYSLTNINAVVTVAAGGKIVVPSGVTVQASKYVFGDTTFKTPGVYTVAQIADLGYGEFVEGEGFLSVELSGGFKWPEPGEIAYLPKGSTVIVTDAEKDRAESVGGFTMFEGSRLVISNITEGLEMGAPIVGPGRLEVWDSTNVVFAADNSARAGAFFVTNSEVVTAHRYGFGSSASPAIEFWTGDAGRLRFRGAGLTNDVSIGVKDWGIPEKDLPPFTLYEGPDNVIVQNGNLYFKRFYYNKLTLANLICNGQFGRDPSGYASEQLSVAYFQTIPNTLLAFNSYFNSGYTFNPGGSVTIRLGEENCTGWFPAFRISDDLVICDAENTLDKTGTIYFYGTNAVVNLNGHDQKVTALENSVVPTEGHPESTMANLTSVRSAAITVNATADKTLAAKFEGEAGLTFNGSTYAYALVNAVSPTKGTLTVQSGTLTLKWGAGWAGRVALAGGTLVVDASAVSTAFSRRTTNLVLGDGKLTVPAGETVVVRSVKQANGTFLEPGVYTPANCTFLTAGSGSVRVRCNTDQKQGLQLILR